MPEPLMNNTLGNRLVRTIAVKVAWLFDGAYEDDVQREMAPLAEAVDALVAAEPTTLSVEAKKALAKLREIADGK